MLMWKNRLPTLRLSYFLPQSDVPLFDVILHGRSFLILPSQLIRLRLILLFFLFSIFFMANPSDQPAFPATVQSSTTTSNRTRSSNNDDPTSTSYIPRMARMIPTSSTVHTVRFKKVCFPMTSRPDELWIVEKNSEGVETWKPIETFLEALDLTHDPATILHSANNLRLQHQVAPRNASDSFSSATHHILPHPEHSDVRFTGPISAIPDHTNILQACWGRSANYHSQGPTTSLYWPPWRNTQATTQTFPTTLTMLTGPPTTPSQTLAEHPQDLRFQDGQLIPFGEMDISDTSV